MGALPPFLPPDRQGANNTFSQLTRWGALFVTSSQRYQLPPGAIGARFWAQGGGGGGGGGGFGSVGGGGGGSGESVVDVPLILPPNVFLDITIGNGGDGGLAQVTDGAAGGNTFVKMGTPTIIYAHGGLGGLQGFVTAGGTGGAGGWATVSAASALFPVSPGGTDTGFIHGCTFIDPSTFGLPGGFRWSNGGGCGGTDAGAAPHTAGLAGFILGPNGYQRNNFPFSPNQSDLPNANRVSGGEGGYSWFACGGQGGIIQGSKRADGKDGGNSNGSFQPGGGGGGGGAGDTSSSIIGNGGSGGDGFVAILPIYDELWLRLHEHRR